MTTKRYTLLISYNGKLRARVRGCLNVHSQPELRQFCAMYLAEQIGLPIDTDNVSWEMLVAGVCVLHPCGCPVEPS